MSSREYITFSKITDKYIFIYGRASDIIRVYNYDATYLTHIYIQKRVRWGSLSDDDIVEYVHDHEVPVAIRVCDKVIVYPHFENFCIKFSSDEEYARPYYDVPDYFLKV